MGKRILILGASGFIGGYLVEHLRVAGHLVAGTYCSNPQEGLIKLDLLDINKVKNCLEKIKPELVIFLAGTKDVARCEKDPGFAVDLNVLAVLNYINSCKLINRFPDTLYLSTDYVFDGLKGYYINTDVVGPKTVYGATNMLAERVLQSSEMSLIILRVSAVMGRKGGFFRWLEESLNANSEVELFDNTYFSPTSVGRLCSFVQNIAEKNMNKGAALAHLSDGYRITRFQFGQLLANKLGKPLSLVLPKCADISGVGFQSDLTLLPDGMNDFLDHKTWNDFGEIY